MLDHGSLYILESHDHQQVLNADQMEKVLTQFFDPRWNGLLDGEVIPVDALFVLKKSNPNYSKLRAETISAGAVCLQDIIPTGVDGQYCLDSTLDILYFLTFSIHETADLVAGIYQTKNGGYTSHAELVWTHSRD